MSRGFALVLLLLAGCAGTPAAKPRLGAFITPNAPGNYTPGPPTVGSTQVPFGQITKELDDLDTGGLHRLKGKTAVLGTNFPNQASGTLGLVGLAGAPPTLNANGEGDIFLSTSEGLVVTGQGSADDVELTNNAGTKVAAVPTGTGNLNIATGDVLDRGTSPTGAAGSGYVRANTPHLVTPDIGAATGASLAVTGNLLSSLLAGCNGGGKGLTADGSGNIQCHTFSCNVSGGSCSCSCTDGAGNSCNACSCSVGSGSCTVN